MAAPIAAIGGTAKAQDGQSIVFWSREGNPERVARTQKNLEAFKEKTGIDVELVVVDETALFTLILVNAAAGRRRTSSSRPVWARPRIRSGSSTPGASSRSASSAEHS